MLPVKLELNADEGSVVTVLKPCSGVFGAFVAVAPFFMVDSTRLLPTIVACPLGASYFFVLATTIEAALPKNYSTITRSVKAWTGEHRLARSQSSEAQKTLGRSLSSQLKR